MEVSVIIPVYNVEKYLKKCLDSVVNQTFKDIEIICVNNGSTDNSLQILKEYAQTDNRIKIINTEKGISRARNVGLDIAAGKYTYFIDSDDWIELNAIEKLVNIMSANDVDVVVNDVNVIPESDSYTETAKKNEEYFEYYRKDNGIHNIPVNINTEISPILGNKLHKTDIINKYHCRFPEGVHYEDEVFIWSYMIHCRNYYYTNDKLYNYLRRENSIMATIEKTPKVLHRFESLKLIYQIVKKYKNIDDYKEYLTNDFINTSLAYYNDIIPKQYRTQALKLILSYYNEYNHDKRILKLYKNLKYKKLKQFLQEIFSARNVNDHKIIKILGFKIKIKLSM